MLGDITVQPQDITILQGQIAAFECKAENALPRTTITWYKDSVRLDVPADRRLFVSDVTGTLFVREVGMADAGQYHCVCENGAGQVTSRVANLTLTANIECEWGGGLVVTIVISILQTSNFIVAYIRDTCQCFIVCVYNYALSSIFDL